MDYSKTDFSATGMIANHQSRAPTPADAVATIHQAAPPDGRAVRPGYRWHEILGEIEEGLTGWQIHDMVRGQEAFQRDSAARARRIADDQALAEDQERTRPRTLEERLDALEATVAKLLAPSPLRRKTPAKASRSTDEGGDLPPAA